MRHLSSSPTSVRRPRRVSTALAIITAGLLCAQIGRTEEMTNRPPAARTNVATAAADSGNSVLITHSDLASIGVHVRRKRLDTPGESLTLEVTNEQNTPTNRNDEAECIVLRDVEGMKDLELVDASAELSGKAARRNSSDKVDSTFLVLGREIDRSYLVFEFSKAAKPDQRYLLPVTAVPRRRE